MNLCEFDSHSLLIFLKLHSEVSGSQKHTELDRCLKTSTAWSAYVAIHILMSVTAALRFCRLPSAESTCDQYI